MSIRRRVSLAGSNAARSFTAWIREGGFAAAAHLRTGEAISADSVTCWAGSSADRDQVGDVSVKLGQGLVKCGQAGNC
jgi:hypothetical protein